MEDLDINFNESYFDFCIFYVTSKDEKRLNEVYHQINYILKPGGILQFIGRPGWELFVSDKFSLLNKIFVQKGDNGYNVWLMKKK